MCAPCEAAEARRQAALALRLKVEGSVMNQIMPVPPSRDFAHLLEKLK